MKKGKVYETLTGTLSSVTLNHLHYIVAYAEQIIHAKVKLEHIAKHPEDYENRPYILYHKGLLDNYNLDLDTLPELTLEFKSEFDKAVESGKYLDVNFCKITHQHQCPEGHINNFNWDEEHDGKYVHIWDSCKSQHKYGELWVIVVTDKMTGKVEDTLTYKNLQKQLEHLECDLKNNIEYCKLFE